MPSNIVKKCFLFLFVLTTTRGETLPDWLEDLKLKVPKAPECGFDAQNRIAGGTIAGMTDFPWAVLIEYEKPDNEKAFHCGGSLINNRYVLTAAHCIEATPQQWNHTNVILGEWNTETDPDCDSHNTCNPAVNINKIVKTVTHPNYRPNAKNKHDNIALLRLEKPVVFSDTVAPICLPLDPTLWNQNYTGKHFTAAGWGRTENDTKTPIKHKVDLQYKLIDECNSIYQKQGIRLNQKLHLCAGGEGKDTCKGDGGGALMYYDVSKTVPFWYAAGISSFGSSKCGDSFRGIYVNVENYLEWISENIYD